MKAAEPRGKGAVTDPAHLPVGPDDAVFLDVLAARLAGLRGVEDCAAVLGMDRLDPVARRDIEVFAAATPDLLVGRADVEHLALGGIGEPEHLADVLRDLPETRLALAQRFLGLPALADVAQQGDEILGPAFGVAHRRDRRQAVDQRAVLATVALLELRHRAARLGVRLRDQLDRAQRVVRMGHVAPAQPEQLSLGIAEQLAELAVHLEKAALARGMRDAQGRLVKGRAVARFAGQHGGQGAALARAGELQQRTGHRLRPA